jgi:hypothetical protein
MSHDKYSSEADRHSGQQSQDALRHQQDALHNKGDKTPLPGVKGSNDSDVDQQAEIPKVGSRDAPGG